MRYLILSVVVLLMVLPLAVAAPMNAKVVEIPQADGSVWLQMWSKSGFHLWIPGEKTIHCSYFFQDSTYPAQAQESELYNGFVYQCNADFAG